MKSNRVIKVFSKNKILKKFSDLQSIGKSLHRYKKLNENNYDQDAQEEKESIIQASKSLIALEIMGGNMLSEPDYDSKLQKYYQAECERQIKEIMKSFGWQEVYVKFNYK